MKNLEDLAKIPSENPNPVLRVTINKILYVNKAGELLLSVKEGDSIPKIIQSGLTEALNHNIFKTLEVKINNLNYIFDIAPITDEGYANIYGRNITDLKSSENLLKQSEKKLRDIIENLPIGISISRPDGFVIEINSQTIDIMGYDSKEEYLKIPASNHYYNPADRDTFLKMLQDGSVKNLELKLKRKDGTVFWGSVSSIRQEIGGQTILINTFQDITDSKKAEEKVVNLAKFPSENPFPVLRATKEKILYSNKAGEDLFKINEGSRPPRELLEWINQAIDLDKPQLIEVDFGDKTFSFSILAIKDEGYANIYGRDITERKFAEIELQKSEATYREAYNRAEFYKDIFTHDINNILQNISSGIQLNEMYLDKPDKSDKVKTNIDIIKRQVKRGANLVSNVRKLSKISESESFLTNVNCIEVLKKSINYIKNSFHDKNLKIDIQISEENFKILANELLEDVFDNILTNSINYNDREIINIEIKVTKELRQGIKYIKLQF
ncbi:MAG: PAS domain-containing sensor histidine kinase, partial [Candidatus Lokiarchaeota archaeon]|nr:PAS domain-containing sensor histidine kinase [Candidatus Lokiarchaeota archaeon]